MPNKEPSKAEVLRGTLDLMVLQTLAALGPQHGYAIGARLGQVSSGALTSTFRSVKRTATTPSPIAT